MSSRISVAKRIRYAIVPYAHMALFSLTHIGTDLCNDTFNQTNKLKQLLCPIMPTGTFIFAWREAE